MDETTKSINRSLYVICRDIVALKEFSDHFIIEPASRPPVIKKKDKSGKITVGINSKMSQFYVEISNLHWLPKVLHGKIRKTENEVDGNTENYSYNLAKDVSISADMYDPKSVDKVKELIKLLMRNAMEIGEENGREEPQGV